MWRNYISGLKSNETTGKITKDKPQKTNKLQNQKIQ
jgi:hypothetical protein